MRFCEKREDKCSDSILGVSGNRSYQREGKTKQTVDHETVNLTGKAVTFDQCTLDGEMKASAEYLLF